MYDPYRALYIHVPFCKQRCRYCDFSTQAVEFGCAEMRDYVENMVGEIRQAGKDGKLRGIQTVYFGGGTPTYLGQKYLVELLYALSLSMTISSSTEVSVEANPDSLDARLVRDMWQMGVNRLSIGVQSFDDEVLSILGRVHDAQAAIDAIGAAQTRFSNISIDLMCGVPGQSIESFTRDVERACDMGVGHVSVYPLTIEPGSEFAKMLKRGELPPIDDDEEADYLLRAQEVLSAHGYARYEVASFAKPGFECKHNQAYWTGVPYLGLGPSAVTMTQNAERRMRVQDGMVQDSLDAKQMLAEDLMMRMRLARGISGEELDHAAQTLPRTQAVFDELVELGLVEHAQGRYVPTDRGWLLGNELYGRIFDLA